MSEQIISKDRVKQFGEVFTPTSLVQEMLSKIPQEIWIDTDKSFIDNSCGRGAFLIEVAKKKCIHSNDMKRIAQSIYGIDIQPDNVEITRNALLDILGDNCKEIIFDHIRCADALTFHYDIWSGKE